MHLVGPGRQRRLDLGDPRLDQPQPAGGHEVRQRCSPADRAGPRAANRRLPSRMHGSRHAPPKPTVQPSPHRRLGNIPPLRPAGGDRARVTPTVNRIGCGGASMLAGSPALASRCCRRRRRRTASRSTSSWCCSPTPPARSTRPRSGCSARATPTPWSTRRCSGRSPTAARTGGSRSPTSNGRASRRRTWWSTGWWSRTRRARGTSARRLMAAPRRAYGSNAIGAALLKGKTLIEGNGFEGWRKVIDLSGDSSWNPQGPPIATARDAVLGAGIVINGLAILCRDALLGPAAGREPRGRVRRPDHRRPRRVRRHRRRRAELRPGGAAQADPRDRRRRA